MFLRQWVWSEASWRTGPVLRLSLFLTLHLPHVFPASFVESSKPCCFSRQRGMAAATSCAILTFVDMMCFSFDSGTEGSRVVIVLLFIQSVNTVRKCIYLIFKGRCVVFQFFLCYKRLGTKLCCFAVALKQNCLTELGTTVSVLIMFLMWKLLHFAWLGEKNYKNVFVFSFFCIISINVFFSHVLPLMFVSVDLLNWDEPEQRSLQSTHEPGLAQTAVIWCYRNKLNSFKVKVVNFKYYNDRFNTSNL